jgi:hypothetical protein
MEDLSLHLLDVVENGIRAGATLIEMSIFEDRERHLLSIVVRDNGRGMDQDTVEKAADPFFTTRRTRRVGLGLPLFKQAAEETGGTFSIASRPGRGTEVQAVFRSDHIDRKPLGDLGSTLVSLIAGNPKVDFVFQADVEGESVALDTREVRAELGGSIPPGDPAVLRLIRNLFSRKGRQAPAEGG